MVDVFVTNLLSAAVSAGAIFIFAGLGEIITNRSGILNLGVEGMITVGALVGFVTATSTEILWLGFISGVIAGMVMASIHAVLCVSLKADQVISGIMLTILGIGLTTFFGRSWVGESVDRFDNVEIPLIGEFLIELPVLGEALFQNRPTDFLAIALVPVVWYFLTRTQIGLETTAIGDDPETADTMGIPVFKIQYACVLVGGAFAGAAGAHLSLAFSGLWVNEMAAGRGWIAVALVIFAQWSPVKVLVGAYLFGVVEALQVRAQGISPPIGDWVPFSETVISVFEFLLNPEIMATYPYLVTIAVLVIAMRGSKTTQVAAPTALLTNYSREGN